MKLASHCGDSESGDGHHLDDRRDRDHQSLTRDKSHGVDKQVSDQRGLADKKATETGTKGTGIPPTPATAETSGGGVSVAAAMGVNIATPRRRPTSRTAG